MARLSKPSPATEGSDSGEGGRAGSLLPSARSEEVGPLAVSLVCVLSFRRTTSSVFPGTMQAFSGKSTYHGPAGPISLITLHRRVFRALDAPEPAASLPGEGFGLTHLRDKSELYAPEQLRCRNEKRSFASLRMTGLRCVVILSETKEPDVA